MIIPKELYDSLFSKCKLHESDISPGSYGGSPIAIQGFFKAELQYKGHSDMDKKSPRKVLQFLGGLHNLNFR